MACEDGGEDLGRSWERGVGRGMVPRVVAYKVVGVAAKDTATAKWLGTLAT